MIRSTIVRRFLAAALLFAIGAGPAFAEGLSVTLKDQRDSALGTTTNPFIVSVLGGTGGGTVAQGAAGSAPWPVFAGQYNATLPTLTTGAPAYVALDASGRLILAPASSISIGNFPATQPVSAATLPLPAGAATAALQSSVQTTPGTSAGTALGIQGATNGVPVKVDGSGVTQPGSIANGSDVALGSTTDAPIVGAASATAATLQAEIKGLYNLLQGGAAKLAPLPVLARHSQSIPASLAASGTYTTASIDTGSATGTPAPYATYTVTASPNQTGSVSFQASDDNVNWFGTSAATNCPAGSVTLVTAPIYGRYVRLLWTNGSTATTGTATLFEQLKAN